MRRREIIKKKKTKVFSTKAKHSSKFYRSMTITNAIASSLAKKVGGSAVDTGKAYSDRRSRKDEYSYGKSTIIVDRICILVQFICYGHKLG